jgi:hypothetical protein
MQKRPRGQTRIKKTKNKNAKVKIRTTPIVMVMIKSKGGVSHFLIQKIKYMSFGIFSSFRLNIVDD